MCETHEVRGCAVCAGIERYEAPEPSEGKIRKVISHEQEALRITGQPAHTRPQAYVHPEPVKREFPQWSPSTDHPRWVGKREYNRNRKTQEAKRLQPSDRNQWLADRLGVTL